MAVEPRLAAGQGRVHGCARRGVAADGELFSDDVPVGEGQAKGGEEDGEVVADIVEVLLGVYQLVEGGDAVVGKEVVVRGCVQTGAWPADVVGPGGDVVVGCVTRGWDLIAAVAVAGEAVLCVVVGVGFVERGGAGVVRIEGACCRSSRVGAAGLLTFLEKRGINAGLVDNPWEGCNSGERREEKSGGPHRDWVVGVVFERVTEEVVERGIERGASQSILIPLQYLPSFLNIRSEERRAHFFCLCIHNLRSRRR